MRYVEHNRKRTKLEKKDEEVKEKKRERIENLEGESTI